MQQRQDLGEHGTRAPSPDGRPAGRAPLLEALAATSAALAWRGCVPGHKGGGCVDRGALELLGEAVFALDLPHDIAGVDTRTAGPPPYAQALDLLAASYGARRAWFLTQGGTQGILAATIAAASRCRRVLVQRSSHISLFSALALTGLDARFLPDLLDPTYGVPLPPEPAELERALRATAGIGAVFVTSPSYFGVVADVGELAAVARRAGAALVVDCSWGPHFGLHPSFPPGPAALGADVTVVSTHKHLGALGQSAVLLASAGGLVADDELDEALALVTSTSASQLLAASVDAARRRAVTEGDRLAATTVETRRRLAAELEGTPFRLLGSDAAVGLWADPLRALIDVGASGHLGASLGRVLELDHGVICEVHNDRLIGFVLGLGEGYDAVRPLVAALRALPPAPQGRPPPAITADAPVVEMTVREARFGPRRRVAWEDAVGQVSAETIAVFPPGIALLVAGEVITAAQRDTLQAAVRHGRRLHGASDPGARWVRVADRAPAGAR